MGLGVVITKDTNPPFLEVQEYKYPWEQKSRNYPVSESTRQSPLFLREDGGVEFMYRSRVSFLPSGWKGGDGVPG